MYFRIELIIRKNIKILNCDVFILCVNILHHFISDHIIEDDTAPSSVVTPEIEVTQSTQEIKNASSDDSQLQQIDVQEEKEQPQDTNIKYKADILSFSSCFTVSFILVCLSLPFFLVFSSESKDLI